ncbi:hypothetical protein [Acinetobacter junii]|uniref:hypothetical protein n=1 Tax=Acinetobacter junii TaxID=40215 RepID=UPI00125EDE29|nr:hypothetical protein [Acinetobacter junii]
MFLLKNNKFIALLFMLVCYLTYFIYSKGFTGGLYFDDFRPLSGLEKVSDIRSALLYIFNETSGPLGRPVSMLSFLINISDWPDNTVGFFRVNTIIHLLNGVLIFFISRKIFEIIKPKSDYISFLSLLVASFWLILPLNISTNLIAVQRMASLSAFFVFLGVLGYLIALKAQRRSYVRGSIILYSVIAICTLLAIFSKENGALLPLLLFVIEITVIAKYCDFKQGRKLRVYSLGLCYLFILGYLAMTLKSVDIAYSSRPYTFLERVLTQPQILIDYIKLLFVPDILSYNPFHDNYIANKSLFASWYGFLSIVFWCSAVVVAVVYRKKFAIMSFAILWFLTAHLLESTVISLELFYEHRNYVASFAVCFFVVYLITTIHGQKSQIITTILFITYLVVLAGCSYTTTKVWGDQRHAAYSWYVNQEGSTRATEHLALMLLDDNNVQDAYHVTNKQLTYCSDCFASHIQKMLIACKLGWDKDVIEEYNFLLNYQKPIRYIGGVPSALSATFRLVEQQQCQSIHYPMLKALNQKFLNSSKIGIGLGNHVGLHNNLYNIAVAEQDRNEMWIQLDNMWKLQKLDWIASLRFHQFMQEKRYQEAIDFLEKDVCSSSDSLLQTVCVQSSEDLKKSLFDKSVNIR